MAQDVYTKENINYLKVVLGLNYVGTTLKAYTMSGLSKVHQSIYRRLAHHQPCKDECSRQYGANFGRWCVSCHHWKRHLEALYRDNTRFQRIVWKQMHSWTWSDGPEFIAEVFLVQGWAKDVAKVNIEDLSTALGLCDNCTEYDIQLNTLKKLREVRNFVAHNPKTEVSDDKLKTYFMVFGVLFHDADLKDFVDKNKCLQDLDEIKHKKDNRLDTLLSKVENMSDELGEVVRYTRRKSKKGKTESSMFHRITIALFIGLLMYMMYARYETQHEHQRNNQCFPESYSIPFTPELQLEGYLIGSSQFTGRQWLVEDLQSGLFKAGYKKKGILVTADMGYGKSAFISHLLCAQEGDIGYGVRKQIIAYHLCKFDVLSTKNPALFIRRLVGMVAIQIPEFGNAVSMQPNTAIIFDKQLCEQDPNGCFDQGFLFPMRNTKIHNNEQKLIVIDALDECSENLNGHNRISELLRHRAKELPDWIALVITSRNTSDTRLTRDILHMHLAASDQRNYDDIKEYIEQEIYAGQYMITKLKHVFRIKSDTILVQKLVDSSGGNFLFLTHAFEYWCSCNESVKENTVPDTLDRIYELNFERIFGTGASNFKSAKLVLEVICASLHRISIEELHDILNKQNSKLVSSVSVRMTLDRLSMFVKHDGKVLMFTHISIRNWLLSEDNTKFSISIENGAAMLSEYLLSELQIKSNEFNFTQLVLHVVHANNKAIEERFMSITKNKAQEIVETNTLHDIVGRLDSPEAVDLVVKHYENIDQRNEKNWTATCIAASKGHLKSFKKLIDLGANLNITIETGTEVDYPEYTFYHFAETMIDYYKVNHFPGYKLLHLASQFGHISIVKLILSKQPSQMHLENSLGNLPFHLACEFGKKEVVEYYIVKHNITHLDSCLYLAAKNQHETVVKFIINVNNSNFQCISEKDANKTLSDIRYFKKRGNIIMTNDHLVRLQDVWWKLRQDSPLHVSVRNGNLRIFKLIASALPLFLDCIDAGGLTPFLASISYQKTDIFKVLVKDRFTDVCSPQSKLKQIFTETLNDSHFTCEQGMGLSHFLALSGTKEMLDHTINNVTSLQFSARDKRGISPLHLAACRGNIEFLRTAYQLGANFGITSENGSTPLHSAVSCHSLIVLFVFRELPFVQDDHNMSLGIYLVKDRKKASYLDENHEITKLYHALEDLNNEIELQVITLLNKNTKFITNQDGMRRNIFHHALSNGHYHIINFLLKSRPELSIKLLQQKDIQGDTPIEYAFNQWDSTQNESFEAYMFPDNCFYTDLFSNHECLKATDLKRLMTHIELSLLYVMMHVRNTKLYSVFSGNFGKLILKSKIYLVPYFLMWAAEEKTNAENFKQQVMYAINRHPEPYNILSIVLLSPETILYCDNMKEPHLHVLLKHMDRILVTIGKNNSDTILKEMCRAREGEKTLLNCSDKAGTSLTEKAVKVKSLLFLNYLIENCRKQVLDTAIDFNKLVKDVIVLNLNTKSHHQEIERRQKIRMHLLKKSYLQSRKANLSSHENEIAEKRVLHRIKHFVNILNTNFETQYVLYQNSHNMSLDPDIEQIPYTDDSNLAYEHTIWERKDELVANILNIFFTFIDLEIFCSETLSFSLIHLVAAGNMHQTITFLSDKLSIQILNCQNKHGVTPLYLAKVFEAEESVQILEKKLKLVLPSKTFEETLIFKLLSDFADSSIQNPLHYLQNHEPLFTRLSPYRFIGHIKSLYNIQKLSILYKQNFLDHFPYFKIKDFKFLFSTLTHSQSLAKAKSLAFNKAQLCKHFNKIFYPYKFLLASIFKCECMPNHLTVYREIWNSEFSVSSFTRIVTCSVQHLLRVQRFTHRLVTFFFQAKYELLFKFAIKELKITFARNVKLFRQEKYFNREIDDNESVFAIKTPKLTSLVRYRYIDILKGLYIKTFKDNV